jgi:hypothetical protein
MLMEKQYNQGDVVSFKLTTGEEIIARIAEDKISEYLLTKPMALLNTSNGGLGMMPTPISARPQDSIVLNKHAVAFHGRCQEDLASQYLEKTTGIKVATNGLI